MEGKTISTVFEMARFNKAWAEIKYDAIEAKPKKKCKNI